jgi:hypothetical protein
LPQLPSNLSNHNIITKAMTGGGLEVSEIGSVL